LLLLGVEEEKAVERTPSKVDDTLLIIKHWKFIYINT
jgi:hypothetical protein